MLASTPRRSPRIDPKAAEEQQPPLEGKMESVPAPTPPSKGKKAAYGASPISDLPTESLSHIFAHLAPQNLVSAQLVCRLWRDVIEDETSWRDAFETYYGILSRGLALGRRLDMSGWRSEYISRVRLLTRWSKSRAPSITHTLNIGPISHLHLTPLPPSTAPASSQPPYSLLSVSLTTGNAIKSSPFTGKVAKTTLRASPLDNVGQPVGLPLLAPLCTAISTDGGKIVWGMPDGTFRFINTSSAVGINARAWAGMEVGTRSLQGHGGPVLALSFGESRCRKRGAVLRSGWYASFGAEGCVAVWALAGTTAGSTNIVGRGVPIAKRLWADNLPAEAPGRRGDVGPVAKVVAFDPGYPGQLGKAPRMASIAVGMSNGVVHLWRGVHIDEEDESGSSLGTYSRFGQEGTNAVGSIFFDWSSTDNDLAILVHLTNTSSFTRYSFTSPSSAFDPVLPPTERTFGHRPNHLGAITSIACDFSDPPLPSTPPALKTTTRTSLLRLNKNLIHFVGIPNSISTASVSSSSSLASPDSTGVILGGNPQGVNAFGRTKYVVAGDAQGRVFVWDWETDEMSDIVEPRRTIQGPESRVTALGLTDVSVFVGGLDGTLRCYDILTSTLLRTFKDRTATRLPARMLAAGLLDQADEERWKVSLIEAGKDSVVAAIGGRILAWQVDGDVLKKRAAKAGSGKMSARTERVRAEWALRQEVKESLSSLSNESSDRKALLRRERHIAVEYGLPPSLDNMTEEEAIALATMLSIDDEAERSFVYSASSSPAFAAVPEESEFDEFSLDGDVLAGEERWETFPATEVADSSEDEEEYLRAPTQGSSYTRSLSIPSSPFIRGSSLSNGSPSPSSRSTSHTWRPASQHSSPSLSAYEPHSYSSQSSNTKIQLSPRLGPTYGSSISIPNDPIPDMSESLWPVARSSASPPTLPRLLSTNSSRPSSAGPSTPIRRGWSDVARSASASPAPSGTSSPALGGNRSLLTASLKSTRLVESREEEELRFAIEMSLAEEVSRLEMQ